MVAGDLRSGGPPLRSAILRRDTRPRRGTQQLRVHRRRRQRRLDRGRPDVGTTGTVSAPRRAHAEHADAPRPRLGQRPRPRAARTVLPVRLGPRRRTPTIRRLRCRSSRAHRRLAAANATTTWPEPRPPHPLPAPTLTARRSSRWRSPGRSATRHGTRRRAAHRNTRRPPPWPATSAGYRPTRSAHRRSCSSRSTHR